MSIKIIKDITDVELTDDLITARNALPDSEVAYARTLFDSTYTNDELRLLLANNRIGTRVCNSCRKDRGPLMTCRKCRCTRWCSLTCAIRDHESHVKWCCQKDGPRDATGPLATAIAKTTPHYSS